MRAPGPVDPVKLAAHKRELLSRAAVLACAGRVLVAGGQIMPQERARRVQDETREVGNASAREALEHPQMLFRFQRDPLEVAMHTPLEQAGARSSVQHPTKRRAMT